jgi:hypothetical protein
MGSAPWPPSQLYFLFEECGRIQFHLHLVICSVIFICFHNPSFVIVSGHVTFTILGGVHLQNTVIFFTYFLDDSPCLTLELKIRFVLNEILLHFQTFCS